MIGDGWLFGPTRKIVSKNEFEKVRSRLHSKNFTEKEIDRVEEIFNGDLNESSDIEKGIDSKEIERVITWLKDHKNEHTLSDNQIAIVESSMREYL